MGYSHVPNLVCRKPGADLLMKILLFANTDWYLYNFRLPLAQALRECGHEVVLVSPSGKFVPRLEEAGFRHVPLPLSRGGANPFEDLATIIRLIRLYSVEKPQIVHHFTVKCVLYGSLAAHLCGVKGILNAITGLGYVFVGKGSKASLVRFFVRSMYRIFLRGSRVIFQNPDDRATFIAFNLVHPQQTHLIEGSGVDTLRFSPTPDPGGTVLVVLPARMLWDKGVAEFVQAASLLKAQGVTARFALVGDSDPGNPAAVPLSQLKEWEKDGIVEWWGWQDDMLSVYHAASIVCLPSYREGLSRTLVEAAACGRPLVASDVPGCRGILYNGENGWLTPVRDPAKLAEAIYKLVMDPEMRKRMGMRGRQLVGERFSIQRIIAETLAVYDSLEIDGRTS